MAGAVFVNGKRIGDYLVENLSAGGALLVHGPRLCPGTRLRIVLRGFGTRPFSLHAIGVRLDEAPDGRLMTAVRFALANPDADNAIQRTVLRALMRAKHPSALLVDPNLEQLVNLADDVGRLGVRMLLAASAVEVVRRLRDEDAVVHAVIIAWSDFGFARRVAGFVAKAFPSARRIAILGPGVRPNAVHPIEVDATIATPWTHAALAAAICQRNAQ